MEARRITVTPQELVEEKTGKSVGVITEHFQIQHEPNSCETTCVTNILHYMGDTVPDPRLKMSLARVNKICGYRNPIGVPPDKLIPNLRKALRPLGYNAVERMGASRNALNRVIAEKGCSFPVVGLSHEYLREERDYRGDNDSDHAVIMLKCTDRLSLIYDPFEAVSPAMARRDQGLGKGVVALHTYRFLDYWKLAQVSRNWTMWIERATVKNETLDSVSLLSKEVAPK